MLFLENNNGEKVAFLYNNAILLADTYEVAGIFVGKCVFGRNGMIRGKFFQNTLYDTEGKIIAIEKGLSDETIPDPASVMTDAWKLLSVIDSLDCPKIEPTETWSNKSFATTLAS